MTISSLEKNRLVLEFDEKELKELELSDNCCFELVKAKKGVWILLETPKKPKPVQPQNSETEQKIIAALAKKDLKERVEGQFERTLSPSEQFVFKKMLEENKVEKFKLNPSYKKAVYQLPPMGETKKNFENKEKNIEEYSLENDGYMVAKTEFAAQKISSELSQKIKEGQVKGTRSFSGEFFIIDSGLFDQKSKVVMELLKAKKNASLQELNMALNMTPTLIKIICAFLSEEGIILEKRRDQYQFID